MCRLCNNLRRAFVVRSSLNGPLQFGDPSSSTLSFLPHLFSTLPPVTQFSPPPSSTLICQPHIAFSSHQTSVRRVIPTNSWPSMWTFLQDRVPHDGSIDPPIVVRSRHGEPYQYQIHTSIFKVSKCFPCSYRKKEPLIPSPDRALSLSHSPVFPSFLEIELWRKF